MEGLAGLGKDYKMPWTMLLGFFAKPLGAAINNLLQAGAAAVIAWAATKGIDAGVTTPIVAGVVGAISLTISSLAATQGVQIPIINADTSNGVRVVASDAAKANSIPKADAPIPKT